LLKLENRILSDKIRKRKLTANNRNYTVWEICLLDSRLNVNCSPDYFTQWYLELLRDVPGSTYRQCDNTWCDGEGT